MQHFFIIILNVTNTNIPFAPYPNIENPGIQNALLKKWFERNNLIINIANGLGVKKMWKSWLFKFCCVENAVHPTNPLFHKASQLPFLLLYFSPENQNLFERKIIYAAQHVANPTFMYVQTISDII